MFIVAHDSPIRGCHVDRHFLSPHFLAIGVSEPPSCRDLDLGGLSLASVATTCYPFGHNPHADHRLSSPPFLAAIASDLPSCCDHDFGGLSLASFACAYNNS